MVMAFSKTQFEEVLGHTMCSKWVCLGVHDGEYVYRGEVSDSVDIHVRSSICPDGWSAGTGEDSIRVWITDVRGEPLGNKGQKWITRVYGWHERLMFTINRLYVAGSTLQYCDRCQTMEHAYTVKKAGPNQGRMFKRCECPGSFQWIQEDE
jgi:hypothetical protein